MNTTIDKQSSNANILEGFFTLLLTSIFIGIAESLSVFFVDHVRVTAGSPWAVELFQTLFFGTIVCGGAALVFGLILTGIASAPILGGKLKPLGGAFALIAVYMIVRTLYSGAEDLVRWIIAGFFALLLIAVVTARPFDRFGKLEKLWPVAVSLLVGLGMWFSVSKFAFKRFEKDELIAALLGAVAPVLLLGFAWTFSYKGTLIKKLIVFAGVLLLVLALMFNLKPAKGAAAPADRPNVVMVVVDTLRADRVWGKEAVMPSVKKLAGEGVYFMNAYSPIGKTQQSVSSFMTGLNPWHTNVRKLHDLLDRKFDTLAEKYSRAGYKTAAFVHNPWIDYGMGHEQGFHQYFDYNKMESFSPLLHNTMPVRMLDRSVGRKAGANRFQTDGKVMTDHVVKWLENNQDGPYFIWVHYFDPHWPYRPPLETKGVSPEDFEKAARINNLKGKIQRGDVIFHGDKSGITEEETAAAIRLYSGEAAYTDSQIDRVIKAAKAVGDTTFIVTADHGESLGEHDYHFHHGEFTYNVCLKVPLLVAGKGVLNRHRVIDAPVSILDIVPTMIEMAGLKESEVDGRVLPDVLTKGKGDSQRPLAFESDVRMFEANNRIFFDGLKGKWRGVVRGREKAIVIPHPDGARFEIYDIFTDASENKNLYPMARKLLPGLIGEMKSLGLKVETEPGTEEKDIPEEKLSESELERLRALGYVQ